MDVKTAIAMQHRAGLKMLRICIERCPDEIWYAGEHPRNFWRIAYHALFFTHLYLQPNEAGFQAWSKHRDANDLWGEPQVVDPFTQSELLSYLDEIDQSVFTFMDRVDLDAPDCGFYWYSMSKIEHLLVNLRHISCHVGQLSERLMAVGIDTNWVGTVSTDQCV